MPRHSLLEQFLAEECTPAVRTLIGDVVRRRDPIRERQALDFNRFSLLLDFVAGTATLTDDLDVTPAGTLELSLDELLRAVDAPSS